MTARDCPVSAGDSARVSYTSERSGNEVSRSGTVARVVRDGGAAMPWLLTGENGPAKNTYAVVVYRPDGDPGADAVVSVTAGLSIAGGPPMPDEPLEAEYETTRRTVLGPLVSLERTAAGGGEQRDGPAAAATRPTLSGGDAC